MDRTEMALRLLEQVEFVFSMEDGIIDPVDFDRFSCEELLCVARGEVTLNGLIWGYAPDISERAMREKLAAWNANANS